VKTREDAIGGCDGIKDGQWGFHTSEGREPWWQVDLGSAETAVQRIVVWNRPQAPERAARLRILLSDDGRAWRTVYQHDGTVFIGSTDQRPLTVTLETTRARFVRIQLPGTAFLHLEEVEVFGPSDPARNLALNRPADQSGVSAWSRNHALPQGPDWRQATERFLAQSRRLEADLRASGTDPARLPQPLVIAPIPDTAGANPVQAAANAKAQGAQDGTVNTPPPAEFFPARAGLRRLALANPLLDFDTLLFTKRVPGSFNHMSDQYYGWWSKPGGGIYLLRGFTHGQSARGMPDHVLHPARQLPPPDALLRRAQGPLRLVPSLPSPRRRDQQTRQGQRARGRVLSPVRDEPRRHRRAPAHPGQVRRLRRTLPARRRIVFLSTRRGQALQVGRSTAARSNEQPDLPDCYVRCGGGPERPVAVYTLHTMNADGSGLFAISPFEMFEWTPEIAARRHDPLLALGLRRPRQHAVHGPVGDQPDGTNARVVFKNYTHSPHCVFEAKTHPRFASTGVHRLRPPRPDHGQPGAARSHRRAGRRRGP
jgi:hypothetical protein